MRSTTVLLSLTFIFFAGPAVAAPYDGLWGDAKEGCQAEASRLTVRGNRFTWYEAQCQARRISKTNSVWRLAMACRGEGRSWRSITSLSLLSRDRLVMLNAPVGPTKRQAYKRCSALSGSASSRTMTGRAPHSAETKTTGRE